MTKHHRRDNDYAFNLFYNTLIAGEYALAYERGWEWYLEHLGGAKFNPYSKKVYPVEHNGWNHGYDDAILVAAEWSKHWRGGKAL